MRPDRMKKKILLALGCAASATIATPAAAQGCTRDKTQEIADSWVAAIEAGSMFKMNLGEWVDYDENFKRSSLGAFLDKPREVNWHVAVQDTLTCKVFVEAVMLDEERPMVTATQMSNGYFGVGPFNNIVTDEGDWLFDAEKTAYYASREDWGEIPEARRNTRDELIAAADAYLDLFNDKSVQVPWGTPCARLEGGIYTGKGQPDDSCDVGVPEGVELTNRQYVVDPVIGAVSVFLEFGEKKRPDSHLFRIEDGKIRYVHTVTNCGDEENCGFPPLSEMLKENPGMQPDLGS
ncbi:hypothetical protein FHS61_002086 [Altererythrobacter atlanticus]|uniref:DUF8021 domain-containing protein n=1 Tax=Croceibacterium atlanticum TaxID=1267766 RepID=A0A0F7KM25_9SPHN|nr:hypothetical protein [Croceibacterium atlanticum]AKH41598.1 hypothetical protein WYH_00540 [Croceibacterium atlanticum]MBB5733060.1 hypothetical protein [Croceibacterium atlanticum]